ncbi:hypothetical protein FDP41_006381 [Naegleria fowleri]|uniref:F-box domain-containing protein n=1 Tax=Naegleria fowleri TaxID=5763 RepID=A0A6A5BN64_NAEFO|nr:uncharacterized protein FDP41_006381 [Naegleria fowleri]KAF0974349.1 hypothetical protein FDP41_006381 [Naegleria fowleri]
MTVPKEILIETLTFLPLSDMGKILTISKTLYQQILETPRYFKSLLISYSKSVQVEPLNSVREENKRTELLGHRKDLFLRSFRCSSDPIGSGQLVLLIWFTHFQKKERMSTLSLNIIPKLLVGGVSALHVYILVLEMFLWNTPRGRKVFRLSDEEFARKTQTLAANQGLYNGFLAAGLAWSLMHPDTTFGKQLAFFFLSCVGVAGVFGAATASKRILYVQTVPAVLAFICTYWLW